MEKILRDFKEALIFVLKEADEKFVEVMAKHVLVHSFDYQDFCTLDHDRVDSRLKARYLVGLIYECLECGKNRSLFHGFLFVLSQFRYSANLSLFFQNELSISGVTDVKEYLQANHIPLLTGALAACTYKWEDIGIALGLPKQAIEECRNGSSNAAKLHNILTCWQQNDPRVSLATLKSALTNPIVRMTSSAHDLNVKLKTEMISKMPVLTRSPSTGLDHPSGVVIVSDGKSTLLSSGILYHQAASYRWTKGGKHLSSHFHYHNISENILLIRHVCQGIEGKYTCNQEKEINLTIIYSQVKKCLLDRYSKNKEVPRDSWPPVGIDTFIDLALINDKKITTELDYSVRGGMDDILKGKEKQDYEELFSSYERGALVLIEGRPGSGKTTLTHKIARDWAIGPDVLKGAKLVFLVSLRILSSNERDRSLSDILEIFYNKEHAKEVTTMLEKSYGLNTCFIIDGLDEYHNSESIVTRLLNKQYLPEAMVIVSSRPIGTAELRHSGLVTKRIEVLGFSRIQISNYISKYSFNKHGNEAAELETYLNSHINVLHMCYLPVHAAMICYIYNQSEYIPSTETKIYEHFTLLAIKRKLNREGNRKMHVPHSLKGLKGETKKFLVNICKLAFDMTVNGQQTVDGTKTEICLSDQSGHDVYSLGLVTVDSTAEMLGFQDMYSFLHLTFQEFLAAFYIAELDYNEQLSIIRDNRDMEHMLMVWKFYCGLMSNLKEQLQLIVSSKSMSNMHKIQCAFESQQENVCACILEADVLEFQDFTFSPTDLNSINYVISKASCSKNITLNRCLLDRSGVTNNIGNVNNINSLCFSTDGGISQFEILNLLLVKLHSLETLDLLNQELGMKDIITLTLNVSLPKLSILKIQMPLRCSCPSLVLFKCLSFNSTNLQQVQYRYVNSVAESHKQSLSHRQSLSHLLKTFKCEIVPLGRFSEDILSNLDVDFSGFSLDFSKVTRYLCLSSLVLVNCNMNDLQVHYLLETWTKFEVLRLDINRITDAGAVCLPSLFSEGTRLQCLSLSFNDIGDQGAMALAGALVTNHSLVELDLQYNAIGDEGALAIAEAVKNFPDEFQLRLWNFRISAEGEKRLLEYKMGTQALQEKVEHAWDVVRMEGPCAVRQAFKCFRHLRTLNLSGKRDATNESLFDLKLSVLSSGLKNCVNLRILILRSIGITDIGLKELAKGLFYCNLEVLDLHDNKIGKYGAVALAELLRGGAEEFPKEIFKCLYGQTADFIWKTLNQASLTTTKFSNILALDVGRNNIGAEGAVALAFGLKCCSKLQSLNLVSNAIRSEGAAALAFGLKCSSKLQSLNLVSNAIHSDGAQALAMGLQNSSSLQTLKLDDNKFSVVPKGCVNLQTLSLKSNDISTSAKKLICDLKCCSNLQYLDLSNNGICFSGVDALGQILTHWKHLQELYIGDNHLGWYVDHLVEGLKCCTELQTLSIQRNGICHEEALVLFEGLRNCHCLRILEFDYNRLNKSAISALVDLLKDLTDIQTVSLRDTNIDDDCARLLVDGLKSCIFLQSLNLSKNEIWDLIPLTGKLLHCTIITDEGCVKPVVR